MQLAKFHNQNLHTTEVQHNQRASYYVSSFAILKGSLCILTIGSPYFFFKSWGPGVLFSQSPQNVMTPVVDLVALGFPAT